MIGARIKEYLKRNGISQTFLADKSGLTISRMNAICNKDTTDIRAEEYYHICKSLNVPFELFMEAGRYDNQ